MIGRFLFHQLLQFTLEHNNEQTEQIIKIGAQLPKLQKKLKWHPFLYCTTHCRMVGLQWSSTHIMFSSFSTSVTDRLMDSLQNSYSIQYTPCLHECVTNETRKLCKDEDRAMRPMYGHPENFPESLTTPTATFPEFLMGFCSD